jgi:hypothetical protein
MTLFSRKGFDETTIDEIVEAAKCRVARFSATLPQGTHCFSHQQKYVDNSRALLAEKRPDKTPFAKVRIACLKMVRFIWKDARASGAMADHPVLSDPHRPGRSFDIEWEPPSPSACCWIARPPGRATTRALPGPPQSWASSGLSFCNGTRANAGRIYSNSARKPSILEKGYQ